MKEDNWELHKQELTKKREKRLKTIREQREKTKKITERTLKNQSPKTKTAKGCYEKKLYICGNCGFSSEKEIRNCKYCTEKNNQKISQKYINQLKIGYDKIVII